MTGIALALHQFRYDQKIFWRNPASVFFTVMFPVMFLVLLGVIVHGQTIHAQGGIDATTYFVPAVITLAVVSATMVNLAMSLTILREGGVLKRLRGTPLPGWVFIAGRIGNAFVTALLMFVLVTALGRLLFGVPVPWSRLAPLLVTLAVGSASFCALGVALTTIIPSREAAPAITNLVVFPLYFLSGVFIPRARSRTGSCTSPTCSRSATCSMRCWPASIPPPEARPSSSANLAVVAAWGVLGFVVALRRFRWEPRTIGLSA